MATGRRQRSKKPVILLLLVGGILATIAFVALKQQSPRYLATRMPAGGIDISINKPWWEIELELNDNPDPNTIAYLCFRNERGSYPDCYTADNPGLPYEKAQEIGQKCRAESPINIFEQMVCASGAIHEYFQETDQDECCRHYATAMLQAAHWFGLTEECKDVFYPGIYTFVTAGSNGHAVNTIEYIPTSGEDKGQRFKYMYNSDRRWDATWHNLFIPEDWSTWQWHKEHGAQLPITCQPEANPGDYNDDGTVNATDYSIWRDNVGQTGDNPADGNGDGIVDTADYYVWRNNYGIIYQTTTTTSSSGDEEPTSPSATTPTPTTQPKRTYSLSFDGTDDAVKLPSSTSLNNLASFTYSAWLRADSLGDNDAGIVIGKGNNGTRKDRFTLRSNSSLRYQKAFSGTDGVWHTRNGTLPMSSWVHVAMTYDRSSANSDPVFYVNGAKQDTVESSAPSGSANSNATFAYTLGALSANPSAFSFNGALDDVRIFNRILSDSEINGLAGSRNSGNALSGLVGHWLFDEGTQNTCSDGSDICDESGNSYHGTWQGTSGANTGPRWE